MTVQNSNSVPKAGIALLAGLSLFWGLNWPGMKIILDELSVWWFRSSCLIVGGLILLAVSTISGNRWKPRINEWTSVASCSLFAIFLWMIFSAYGVSQMPAGRASIIAFTMPLWATIFARFMLGEAIDKAKVVGLIIGLSGLAVLIGPDLMAVNASPAGALSMLCAAITWAFGTIWIKRSAWSLPVASHVAWQLLVAALPMTLIALWLEPFPNFFALSTSATIALVYLYLFPMSFCQWAYMKVVKMLPASIAAIGTLMVPIFGVYSSHLILSEPVGWRELSALILVCSALACVLVVPNLPNLGKAKKN